MSKRSTGFALFSGLVGLVAACGGSALNDGGASHAQAGAGVAGAASAGAGSGGAGSPGAGAASDDACSAPMVAGQCDAYLQSFWHNPQTGLCEPFFYGGCGGNANRYATRDDCLSACPGGGSNWGACQKQSDCTLTHAGCCEACEPDADSDLLALNASHLADYQNAKPCASVGACLPCQPVSVLAEQAKYFQAVCVAGQCTALDVRMSPYTACDQTSDCTLRSGVQCCQRCDGGFVAVNANANFCPDGNAPCPQCAIQQPQYLLAVCQNQRCVLEETLK